MAGAGFVRPGGRGIPEFQVPKFDAGRVTSLQQELAAPSISKLRRGLSQIQARRFGSPAQRGFAERQALSGFGEGLGGVLAGARQGAVSELAPQFQAEQQAEMMRFRARLLQQQEEERQRQLEDIGREQERFAGTERRRSRRAEEDERARRSFGQTVFRGSALTPRVTARF